MLTLGRKVGENIKVFKVDKDGKINLKKVDFMITVLSIEDGMVKLGINSEKDYKFWRNEIYQKLAKNSGIEPIRDRYSRDEILKKWGTNCTHDEQTQRSNNGKRRK